MKTSEKIVQQLKLQGALTAKVLAQPLGLTTMGVRQHLQSLEDEGVISYEDKKAARGRPTRYWSLTQASQSRFTDRHGELTVQLIDSVKSVFGDQGLEQLISHREQATFKQYHAALSNNNNLADKLTVLAQLRSNEGYMANVEQGEIAGQADDSGIYWLLENHCPICDAANSCLNFCRSELQLFQDLFKGLATVSREEHILDGARRCAYRVSPV